jgi:hypothetical protein
MLEATRRPRAIGHGEQCHLAVQGIDAVDDIVGVGGQYVRDVVRIDEACVYRQRAIRVDVADAPRHHLGLVHADAGEQGGQLPVDVGDGNLVVVHQGQATDAGARQGLGAPGADAAQAGEEDVAPGQAAQAFGADQDLGALELGRHRPGAGGHRVHPNWRLIR